MWQKLRRLARYARPHRGKVLAIIVMTLIASAMSLLQPWPLKILVDFALGGPRASPLLEKALAEIGLSATPFVLVGLAGLLTFAIFAVNSVLDIGLSWAWMATGQRMVYDLACDTLHQLLRLSLSYHSRHSVGDHLARLSDDTWCIYKVVSELLVSPFQRILIVVGIGAVAWILDPLLTLVAFSVAPLVAVSVWYFGPRIKQRAKHGREAQSRMTGFVHQTVTAIPLVQAYGTEATNRTRFEALADDVVTISQQGVLLNKSYGLINGLANAASHAAVIFAGGWQVVQGHLSLGSLLVFLAYVRNLQDACTQLLQTYARLKESEASFERLFEILDANEVVRESRDARLLSGSTVRRGMHVRVEDVCFGYAEGHPVLNHVSLEVLPGQKIALVGPSGAGKTTLASLLPRLHDPWKGRILLDGMDTRQIAIDSLRSQIAVMLQEAYLLPISIAENIAIGRPNATRQEIIAAAIAANADDFVSKLPAGYDTVIGQRGSTLSTGQKQRIAIARALVRNAPLLILDEPTSALDAQSEASLLEAFQRLMEGRTTIIIAHRLSTIRNADRIFVLQDGSILEAGTHEELCHNGQLYSDFYAAQSGLLVQERVA